MFQNGNFMNQFGGFLGFQEKLNSFKQQMDMTGNGNYQQLVQNLINNGQMTQEQFNQFRAIANQITGQNF